MLVVVGVGDGDADHGGVELAHDVATSELAPMMGSAATPRFRRRGALRSSTCRVRECCQIVVAKGAGESPSTRGEYGMAAS